MRADNDEIVRFHKPPDSHAAKRGWADAIANTSRRATAVPYGTIVSAKPRRYSLVGASLSWFGRKSAEFGASPTNFLCSRGERVASILV